MTPSQVPLRALVQPACSGLWSLEAGRAMRLRPRQAGSIKVMCGQVWATTDAPFDCHARRLGDHVLSAGEGFSVQPGERVVLEAWGDSPVRFDWVPDMEARPVAPSRWHDEVLVPSRQLGQALGGTVVALGRLAWGVGAYTAHLAGFLAAGRGRVLSRFESDPP